MSKILHKRHRVRRALSLLLILGAASAGRAADALAQRFATPPEEARPWVYWMFMDGNMTRAGLTADLEAMRQAGIGGAIMLEVNIGIPRGSVNFMSPPWRELVAHAAREADRLGIELALPAGPGWCGSGGPWVKPEQSMQHLVASEAKVAGPAKFDAILPRPAPRTPFFGMGTLTPPLHKLWSEFYIDVKVLAFPTPVGSYRIPEVNEKALYFRAPYSSQPGVKPFLSADAAVLPADQCVDADKVVDLTGKLAADGRLVWDVPPGNWTIMRFGRTITGQTSRPAPEPGLGLESDKFEKGALDAHFGHFLGELLKVTGEPKHKGRGITTVHFDSWEMSSQNWSEHFHSEFKKRRGYDPTPYLPAMSGYAVGSVNRSERFLWDLRKTAQELVVENHLLHLKKLGREHGMALSVEPYDLNPAGDLTLGGAADVPMCEFWSRGWGFNTDFSCFEAVSIAHTMGRPVVGAEAFTSLGDGWMQHPASMKAQGDWALCAGINRFVFHRYQHQPWLDRFPGMTFGQFGIYWDRTQTWWGMASAYHTYLARCQALLRRGVAVADVLYLDREDAPCVFRPPASALQGGLPDRRGYNFDGCAPSALIERASVRKGRIVFPDGMSYRLLVLPDVEAMTPELLKKIRQLVRGGALVVGKPPKRAPGLAGYPECDQAVQALAADIWKRGRVRVDVAVGAGETYPDYSATAGILAGAGVPPDFESDGDLRYLHRRDGETDIYFVGNRKAETVSAQCRFRVAGRRPELWDPVTGLMRLLPEYEATNQTTTVPLRFEAGQSFFVVFREKVRESASGVRTGAKNFGESQVLQELTGAWEVAFDPKWGGPARAAFASLQDWTARTEEGVRHYSGTAVYRKIFDGPAAAATNSGARLMLDLGDVRVMARVELNGKDLGVVWCVPWRVEVPAGLLRPAGNQLQVTVANLWCNRLIGDSALPADKRLTWTTHNPFNSGSALQPSGLLGPVRLLAEER